MKAIVTALPGSSPASAWTRELAGLLERAPRGEDLASSSDHDLIDLIAALERGKGALGACQAHAEVVFRESPDRRAEAPGGRAGGARQRGRGSGRACPQNHSETCFGSAGRPPDPRRDAAPHHQAPRAGRDQRMGGCRSCEERARPQRRGSSARRPGARGEAPRYDGVGLGRATRARAQELDPAAAVKRASRAVAERRVSIRPAPDGMSILHAILPTKDGVACFKALTRESKSAKSWGMLAEKGRLWRIRSSSGSQGRRASTAYSCRGHSAHDRYDVLACGEQVCVDGGFPIPGRAVRDIALGVVSAPAEEPSRASDRPGAPGAPGAPVTEHSSQTPPMSRQRMCHHSTRRFSKPPQNRRRGTKPAVQRTARRFRLLATGAR